MGDVEVIMGAFVVHLIGGELLLRSVETDTDFFLVLLDLGAFGLGLLVLQLELLLASEVLLLDLLLQACVELVVGRQELEILLSSFIGHRKLQKIFKS